MEFKKTYKKLCKAYSKKLKKIQKNSFISLADNLEYFVNYLKFIRDYLILTEPATNSDGTENCKITTIAAAIAEYEQYLVSCDSINWLKSQNSMETDASLNKYTIEKQLHWNYFWEIVKQNGLLWEVNDVTI